MKRPVVVGPIAEREIVAAARWYEAREIGLGQAFIDELLHALDAIEEGAETFPFLREPYRRKLLDRFLPPPRPVPASAAKPPQSATP